MLPGHLSRIPCIDNDVHIHKIGNLLTNWHNNTGSIRERSKNNNTYSSIKLRFVHHSNLRHTIITTSHQRINYRVSTSKHITLPTRRTLLKRTAGLGALCLLGARATPVLSQQSVTISAVGVKFDPMFVFIEPGDTVNWQGMAGHNVESIDAMVPEGYEKFNSTLGEDVSIVFNTPGIVMYKCTPHWGTRMGGGIVVGKPDNAMAIVDAYTAAIESDRGLLLPAKGLLKKLGKEIQGKGW